jgi:alkylation response protein AidB-like acyl-CoA dehydrogenase
LTDSDWEAIEATAKEENGEYVINATKTFTVAGSHNLTSNVIHLVLGLIDAPDSKKQKPAWFVVPLRKDETDNHVSVDRCHEPIGLKGVPFCTLSFGKTGPTKGQLLSTTGDGEKDLYKSLNGLRSQLALQGVALAGQVFQEALQYASLEPNSKNQSKKRTAALISYPHIADHIMYMKAVTEASRAAVYSIAFFSDCSIHGGKEQQEFFSDLTDIYTGILKVHASQSGLKSISRAIQVFGKPAYAKDNVTEQNYRSLQAATLFGGSNDLVAQELLDRIVHYKEGSMIDHLIKQFGSVEVNEARSEPMKEAIRVWQDYIGGIIVLMDDLKKGAEASQGNEEVDPRLSSLWADRIVKLIGDVIYCYHLVTQGMEAEKKLEQKGVNFYNLQQDVSRDQEAMAWYDRLLTAEYFALNVLSENESNIRIIQRNASSALEAFFLIEAE